jgi:hypothetical protein
MDSSEVPFICDLISVSAISRARSSDSAHTPQRMVAPGKQTAIKCWGKGKNMDMDFSSLSHKHAARIFRCRFKPFDAVHLLLLFGCHVLILFAMASI